MQTWQWDISGDKVSTVLAIASITGYVILPIFMFNVIHSYAKKGMLKLAKFERLYGVLTNGLRVRTAPHLAY